MSYEQFKKEMSKGKLLISFEFEVEKIRMIDEVTLIYDEKRVYTLGDDELLRLVNLLLEGRDRVMLLSKEFRPANDEDKVVVKITTKKN